MRPRLTLNSQCSLTSLLSAECWDSSPTPATPCVFLSPNTWVYHFHYKMCCGDEAFLSIMWLSLESRGRGFLHLQLNAHCQMIIPECVFFAVMSQPGVKKFTALPLSNLKKFFSVMGICVSLISEKAGMVHKYTDVPLLLWMACLYCLSLSSGLILVLLTQGIF